MVSRPMRKILFKLAIGHLACRVGPSWRRTQRAARAVKSIQGVRQVARHSPRARTGAASAACRNGDAPSFAELSHAFLSALEPGPALPGSIRYPWRVRIRSLDRTAGGCPRTLDPQDRDRDRGDDAFLVPENQDLSHPSRTSGFRVTFSSGRATTAGMRPVTTASARSASRARPRRSRGEPARRGASPISASCGSPRT